MTRKRLNLLVIGFKYQEMNRIHDSLIAAFGDLGFDFAISIRESLYRMNIHDYQIIILNFATAEIDDIIGLKEIIRRVHEIQTIITVHPDDISKLPAAVSENVQSIILKDHDYLNHLLDSVRAYLNEEKELSKIESDLNTKARSLFQSLIDTVSEQVVAIGMDYRIKLVNQAVLKKYESSPQQVAGRYCYEFFYRLDEPCRSDNLPCPMRKISLSGQSCQMVHKPRKGVKLHISAFPLTNEFNTVVEILVTSHEMTQPQLSFDNKLLQVLIDGYSEALLFFDSENNVVFMNEKAEKILESDRQYMLGQTIFRIPLGKGLHWLGKVIQNAKSGRRSTSVVDFLFNEKEFVLRFDPVYTDKNHYNGAFLYLIEKTEEGLRKEIENDIINISKFFTSKIVAEG